MHARAAWRLQEVREGDAQKRGQLTRRRIEIAKNQEPQLYRTGTMGPEDKILCGDGHKWIDPKDDRL